jgi:DNA-binding XRE family transcriptional regulator
MHGIRLGCSRQSSGVYPHGSVGHCGYSGKLLALHLCVWHATRERSSYKRIKPSIGVMMHVTGEQLRAARAMARMEQADLARLANVSVDTIKRLEKTIGPVSANIVTIYAVLEVLGLAGIEFIAENGGGPGVRLRKDALAKTGKTNDLKIVKHE